LPIIISIVIISLMPTKSAPVAYFCAEFGIDSNLPTYAGGLGILAGDTLLEAGQQEFPMIGVGLLYQGRQFLQEFSSEGWQEEDPSPFQPEITKIVRPIEKSGMPVSIQLNFLNQEIKIVGYEQRLGPNTKLLLLSCDVEGNPEDWRNIMSAEYCCGDETQLRQQLVLGIGGARFLSKLNVKPRLYHFQEGRPVFAYWEMLKNKDNTKIVYTNHTLVPDGNLVYSADLVRSYADSFAQQHGLNSDDLINPGLNETGGFSITKYGLEIADTVSAVSKLHGKLCQKNWPQYEWKTVTNGVHLPRWQKYEFRHSNIPDEKLWSTHQSKKQELARIVNKRSGFEYDPNRLVLGWARRISAYKQVNKIFEDIQRLEKIVKNSERPVQILIAGKAHPGDDAGKKCVQDVMKIMTKHLSGHALFIPNYDIALASHLVSGVDVWLNTPEYGKEACGTSGMKAAANGVLNCSVTDGWVAEANIEESGWTIDHTDLSNNLYHLLEHEIAPLYYADDKSKWIAKMRTSLKLAQQFSAERMLKEYHKILYQ